MQSAKSLQQSALALAVTAGSVIAMTGHALASAYVQTNLVSDIPGLATVTDPQLVNPWGLAFSATGPFWVSDQGTNNATLYSVSGSTNVSKAALTVAIPTTSSGPQGPTGQVFSSSTTSFQVGNGGNGAAARFIFGDLNGTISAWNGGTTSFVQATTPGAIYVGLAVNSAQTMLYAANGGSGAIDVFNSSFAPVATPGKFVDPNLPAGLVPFNVQDIGGKVYVTYGPPGRANQIAATAGQGAVAVFDENGNFLQQLISGSELAAPWGLALAPASFGEFGGDLLVGNFSFVESEINAFDPVTGAFLGTIGIDTGGNTPGGLWSLAFGNGGTGGSPNTLYVTDGINGERDGLLAAITVPEPSSLALLGLAMTLCWLPAMRRRR